MTTVAKSTAPITQTSAISVESLPYLGHGGMAVITTEHLAKIYGTEPVRIQQNHKRNSNRFIAGKHFFKVVGDELKNLRLSFSKSQNPVSSKTRSLILWTERGAARHAKMLETDQAWDVFEQLEDCYFSVKAEVEKQTRHKKSSTDERTPLRQYVEKMIANKSGMKYPDIWGLVHERFDVQHINQLSASESLEAVEYLKTLEGEWIGRQQELPKPEININYPLEWFQQNSGYVPFQHMQVGCDRLMITTDMLVQGPSPSLSLLNHLKDYGYEITAPYMEVQTLRHIMFEMRRTLAEIAAISGKKKDAAMSFRV